MKFPNSRAFNIALLFICLNVLGCSSGSRKTLVISGTLAGGTVGTPYNQTLTAVGGEAPYTWTITGLPAGLQAPPNTSATQTVTGTPTTAGSSSVSIGLTDSTGLSASEAVTVVISTTVTGVCTPRGNEAALTSSAPYAFLVKGSDTDNNSLAIAGSFTPNADGSIKAAAADFNSFSNGYEQLSVNLGDSSYSFGSDSRGCLSLAVSPVQAAVKVGRMARTARRSPQVRKTAARGKRIAEGAAVPLPTTITFSFVLGEKTGSGFQSGRIIEFDQTATGGTISSGMMHVQTPSAFKLSALQPNYAFGLDGWDTTDLNRLVVAGTFINTAGTLSGGVTDINSQGAIPPNSGELDGASGTINSTIDASTGRGTGTYAIPVGPGSELGLDFAIYVVNGTDFYIISTDRPNDEDNSSGLLSGQALATKASFTPGSLNGSYLLAGLGFDTAAFFDVGLGNVAEIGNFTANSGGAIVGGNIYVNDVGAFSTNPISAGTYVTQTSGRTTIAATGSGAPVGYLTGPSSDENVIGFFVGTDIFATSGTGYLQTTAAPNFSPSVLSTPFAMGSDEDVDGQNGSIDGIFTFDGSSKYTAVVDVAFLGAAPAPGQTTNGTFTVNADGSGNLTLAGGNLAILTNGTQIFAIDVTASGGGQIDPLLYVFTIVTEPD